jgi:ankyrin repeat protein
MRVIPLNSECIKLPNDILAVICNHFNGYESSKIIKSLCRVSKGYVMFVSALYADKTINDIFENYHSCYRTEHSPEWHYKCRIISINALLIALKLSLISLQDVNPSMYNNSVIDHAVYIGDIEITKLLLANSRIDISANHFQLVRTAVIRGYVDIVMLLLSNNNQTTSNNLALRWAAQKGRTDIVRLLLENFHTDPSTDDNCVICDASCYGHAGVVKLLLQDLWSALG